MLIWSLVLLQAASPPAGPPRAPAGRQQLFISPMGEPFRGAEPQFLWFDQADTNHDGVVTRAEFEADAARFFARLDREHHGEIDPGDIEHYETQIVPEVRVGYSEVDSVEQNGAASRSDSEPDKTPHVEYPDRQGAGRYSWFDYPEPVTVCDTDLNRGIDADEFKVCADKRFAMLDTGHSGALKRSELLAYSPQAGPRGNPDGTRTRGRHGGGHRGGGS